MNDECLATGFGNVDDRADVAAYSGCLSLLDSLPYFRKYKQRSYELLELFPGVTVLEVGCGLGDDAFRMAELVKPGGSVAGVDASARMLETASARNSDGLGIEFRRADARSLPFRDGSFMRCRTDRTLQHIARPECVIAEMARVLAPDGILLAYDNDWGTFSVSGADRKTTSVIEDLWAFSFTNPWIGRYLKQYFRLAGLTEITVYPSVSVINDFELADQVYNLRQTAFRAVEAGKLARKTAGQWLSDLEKQDKAGYFLCSLTAYTVAGRKRKTPHTDPLTE